MVEGGAARLFFGIEKKEQILLLLVNTVTNPVAVLLSILLPVYTGISFNMAVLAAEVLVFIAEGFLFRKCMIWHRKRVRSLENGACSECISFGAGLVVSMLMQ